MLGFGDIWVFMAYILSILSTLFCLGYCLLKWNEDIDKIDYEDISWMKEEVGFEEEV